MLKQNSEKPRERGCRTTDCAPRTTRRQRRAYYRSAVSPVNGARSWEYVEWLVAPLDPA